MPAISIPAHHLVRAASPNVGVQYVNLQPRLDGGSLPPLVVAALVVMGAALITIFYLLSCCAIQEVKERMRGTQDYD